MTMGLAAHNTPPQFFCHGPRRRRLHPPAPIAPVILAMHPSQVNASRTTPEAPRPPAAAAPSALSSFPSPRLPRAAA